MSRFSIDETYPDPQPENAGTGLIASVTINPERPFIAAASALAAHMAGSDLILARAAALAVGALAGIDLPFGIELCWRRSRLRLIVYHRNLRNQLLPLDRL